MERSFLDFYEGSQEYTLPIIDTAENSRYHQLTLFLAEKVTEPDFRAALSHDFEGFKIPRISEGRAEGAQYQKYQTSYDIPEIYNAVRETI